MVLSRLIDKEGEFDSPLAQGRIDRGYENLHIRLLHAPKMEDFVLTAVFTEFASSGGGKGKSPLERLDELQGNSDALSSMAEKFMHGGLEQFLEADTVTFLIYGCSRGFTHEFVRTRKGAWFVQQTMRHSNMGNANLRMPEFITRQPLDKQQFWIDNQKRQVEAYMKMVEEWYWPYEDARSVLPIGTETWIIGGMPIRTFLETYAYRACYMFYPEMQWIFRECGRLLKEQCPWLADKVKISCEIPNREGKHNCHYRGTEPVEGMCPLPWAKEELRLFKSKLYNK